MFIDGARDLKFTLFPKRKMEVSAAYKHFAATRLF